MGGLEIRLRALTPLWTGGVDQTTDRLHETGLIGSLRWWYEALVRGLGGYACDPTSDDRCPDKDGKHCAACELFGCTGWARKFRLNVISKPKIEKGAIAAGQVEMAFIPLRNIEDEEWCLLEATLRLVSDYGAIGGKTIFKPSDESDRQSRFHHQDFGLVEIHLAQGGWRCSKTLEEIKAYLKLSRWRSGPHKHSDKDGKNHDDYSWASLGNFWCVKGRYLARQDTQNSSYNRVLGRKQPKQHAQSWDGNSRVSRWLAGSQQESKKVFSFKHPPEKGRTFGFVKPGTIDYEGMKERLQAVWEDFNPDEEFITGEQIIQKLFSIQPSEPAGGAP